jgi:hypothetical protein
MLTRVHGKLRFFNRIQTVKRNRPGHYSVTAPHGEWKIFGGKHAGGRSNEWFLEGSFVTDTGEKAMYCISLMQTLRVIDGM